MSFDTERMMQLLPAIYRLRDAAERDPLEARGPLEALISVLAEQSGVLEEDLAQLENTDGNWDDSDDEDDIKKKVLAHSGSKATLASGASSNDFRSGDESNDAVDVWDL